MKKLQRGRDGCHVSRIKIKHHQLKSNVFVLGVCILTLVYAAVIRGVSPSSCRSRRHTSRNFAEWVTSVGAVWLEAHTGTGAQADVRRQVWPPWEVLRLSGRHGEAHRCHYSSLERDRGWVGALCGMQEKREGEGGVTDWPAGLS